MEAKGLESGGNDETRLEASVGNATRVKVQMGLSTHRGSLLFLRSAHPESNR